MFTGLITDVGTIERVANTGAGRELRIKCGYEDLAEGESIAVNGVCLTVREHGRGWFVCAAVVTTLEVTTIDAWAAGKRVNLERALRATDRLGGHFVMGHVDGVARVTRVETVDDALVLDLALPAGLSELSVEKGSVAIDGVSLTIAALPGPDTVRVSIIEYTRRSTTLNELVEGSTVHIEADVLAKHVRRLLAPQQES
jgi:riboflavin synthase